MGPWTDLVKWQMKGEMQEQCRTFFRQNKALQALGLGLVFVYVGSREASRWGSCSLNGVGSRDGRSREQSNNTMAQGVPLKEIASPNWSITLVCSRERA